MKLYKANLLYTPAKERFVVVEGGYIAVDDKGYVEGVYEAIPDWLLGVPVTDFGDKIIIPAMNDMHVHAPQYRNMGLAMDLELLPWLNTYTFPEESKFRDSEYARKVYSDFIHDLWLNGTMRTVAFATVHRESTMILADLFNDIGMGALLGIVGMDRNCPETLTNTAEQAAADTLSLMQYTKRMNRVGAIVTPRFVPSCTPEMMDKLGAMAILHGLPVQSHLSENRAEITWVKELEPESTCYGDAYRRHCLFGNTPTLMAHCCYSDSEERKLMRENKVFAVHCPTSNCNLGSGIALVRTLLNEGNNVVLGSDISGGHTLSMFEVMRYVMEMSKLQFAASEGKTPFLKLSEVFYLATKAAGEFFDMCGMDKVGSFEKGYAFDALVIEPNRMLLEDKRIGAAFERFMYCGSDRQIVYRYCQGKEIIL